MNELYNKRLKEFRNLQINNKSQLSTSEMLDISPEHYSKIENGVYNPSIPLHIKICLLLNRPSDCFFKENRKEMTLTKQQYDYLQSLDSSHLKKLLQMIQAVVCINEE